MGESMDDICFNKKDTRAISRLERGMNDIASRDTSVHRCERFEKNKRNIYNCRSFSDVRKILQFLTTSNT